jgi:hypothetical protein
VKFVIIDIFALASYTVFAIVFMLWITDADRDTVRTFMAGFWTAGTGVLLAMWLGAKRRVRDGRQQEGRAARQREKAGS